jgi:putative glutamine amidotransferase
VTTAGRRPLIAIPARFSASASALRFRASVAARRLVEAVYAAGGEPVVVHPAGDADPGDRLWFADGILLPGGGDVAAHRFGGSPHAREYDVDDEQDAFDLAVARCALAGGIPLLAVCRGAQVVNVALGGDLVQDLGESHRHLVHTISTGLEVSCYHHQGLGRLGKGLRAVAHAADGTIEAITLDDAAGWFLGVQWHPEDTYDTDPRQADLFRRLVRPGRSPRWS